MEWFFMCIYACFIYIYAGCDWGIICQHSSDSLLQYQFSTTLHWHRHSLQQPCMFVYTKDYIIHSSRFCNLGGNFQNSYKEMNLTIVACTVMPVGFFVCVYIILPCRGRIPWVLCGGSCVVRCFVCVALFLESCPGRSCLISSSTETLRRYVCHHFTQRTVV